MLLYDCYPILYCPQSFYWATLTTKALYSVKSFLDLGGLQEGLQMQSFMVIVTSLSHSRGNSALLFELSTFTSVHFLLQIQNLPPATIRQTNAEQDDNDIEELRLLYNKNRRRDLRASHLTPACWVSSLWCSASPFCWTHAMSLWRPLMLS